MHSWMYAKSPTTQDAFQPLPGQLSCLLSYYLRVSDTDDTFYEAILFCGLEDRHTVLSILLHSLGTTIRPVLVAHLLQWREYGC